MYKYRDQFDYIKNEQRPAEAVAINGDYLEDAVEGYRTLYVTGRESLAAEMLVAEHARAAGDVYIGRTYPSRTITVGFQLAAKSPEDYRDKFNTLNTLLAIEQAEFIFNDEPEKYFIGTPHVNIEPEPGQLIVTGEWEIFCADPFKYEIEDTVVTAAQSTEDATVKVLTTVNDGAVPTFPRFAVTFPQDETDAGDVGTNSDCGYVLMARNNTDYSIQFGDDEEKDTTTLTDLDANLTKSAAGFSTGATATVPFSSAYLAAGTVAMYGSSTSLPGLRASGYGANTAGKYHGPFTVMTLPHPRSGAFTFSWQQVLACSNATAAGKKQGGAFWALLLDANNNPLYGIGYYKSSKTNLTANARYICKPQADGIMSMQVGPSYNVAYTGPLGYKATTTGSGKNKKTTYSQRASTQTIKVYKGEDNYWHFDFNVGKSTGYASYVITDLDYIPPTVAKVAFFFTKYGSNDAFSHNRVINAKFAWGDYNAENTFVSGDVLNVDTASMNVELNNANAAQLGDITNDWENMALDVGANLIICQWSDWTINAPEFVMKYKRRWI